MKRTAFVLGVALALGVAGTSRADCSAINDPGLPGMGLYVDLTNKCTQGTTTCINSDATVGATFSPAIDMRTVGVNWATWAIPPEGEELLPYGSLRVGSPGLDVIALTITLSTDAAIAGVEMENNVFTPAFPATVIFLDGGGAELIRVTRNVLGAGGARLFAASCDTAAIHSITINADPGSRGFALGNVRSNMFPPPAGATEELIDVGPPNQSPSGTMNME